MFKLITWLRLDSYCFQTRNQFSYDSESTDGKETVSYDKIKLYYCLIIDL